MRNRRKVAAVAVTRALRTRLEGGLTLHEPICVYDLAETLGIEVRFIDISSMEGMYVAGENPTILLSSLRPAGRQAYNCAHELGHAVLGHGVKVDEFIAHSDGRKPPTPDECQADIFAGILLMPKTAVARAFALRGWDPAACTPLQVYEIAGNFGVGYTTLIYHMWQSIGLVHAAHARRLLEAVPKQLRSEAVGQDVDGNLFIVNEHWSGRPVDIEVGDIVLLPGEVSVEGGCVVRLSDNCEGVLIQGCAPGAGRIADVNERWAVFVRVSRREYVGRSIFRHLEDEES